LQLDIVLSEGNQNSNQGKYKLFYFKDNSIIIQFLHACKKIIIIYCISAGEPQILDYQTQQYKIFPAIAISLAYKFAATWLWNVYNDVTSKLEEGDLERLPEV